MPQVLDDTITQLKDPRLGHGPLTVGLVTNALTNLSPGSSPKSKYTACFDPHGQPSLEHFKQMINQVTPPARLHVPLGLGMNHITALVVDIDAHGNSEVLFFNSLGNSNKGQYYQEAKLFISAVNDKFPVKNERHTTKKFQDLSSNDNFCGDWSIWFLRTAASKSSSSLKEIEQHFDHLPNSAIPSPQESRANHIQI
jgi:hypothetical protein